MILRLSENIKKYPRQEGFRRGYFSAQMNWPELYFVYKPETCVDIVSASW